MKKKGKVIYLCRVQKPNMLEPISGEKIPQLFINFLCNDFCHVYENEVLVGERGKVLPFKKKGE